MESRWLFLMGCNFTSGLAGLLALAVVVCVYPVHAHISAPEEIQAINTQIAEQPDSLELHLLRGDLHRGSKHWSEAIADFRKVLQMDRSNAAAELGIGNTWFDQGHNKRAIKHLNRSLALLPGNVRALVSRARDRSLSCEFVQAAVDYQRAIDTFKAPKDPLPEYYFEQARALEASGAGNINAAIEVLDAGITRLGDLRIVENYAIELERKRGNYTAALQLLDRIIDRSVRKEALLLTRGQILLESGQLAAAKADFVAALEAIDALPAQRRQNRLMKQMRSDIERRFHDPKLVDLGY